MKTISLTEQNLLLAGILLLGAPWLWIGWETLTENTLPLGWILGMVVGLQGLEMLGITLKVLPLRKSLQTQWRNSCLSLIFMYGIGLPYIALSNLPSLLLLAPLGESPLWIGGVITFLVLKYLYYILLAQSSSPQNHAPSLHQTAGDWSLTLFTIVNASFYLHLIQSGITEPTSPSLTEFLWATFPAVLIFGPLEFPRILLNWPTLKNRRKKGIALLSILGVTLLATWQLFH